MTNRILFFSLSLVFTAFSAAAQQEVADSQFWLDYNTSIKLDDRWSVGGDVAARGQVSNADWYQIVARPGVQYRVNNWLAPAAGVGLFSTFNQYQEDVNELRFYQDLSMHVHTLPLVDPLGRLRLEERFMVYEVSASEWIVRARLLVGLQTKDIPIGTQAFFLQGLWEGFWSVSGDRSREAIIDQSRIDAAIGHRFAQGWRYELHYIWQRARGGSDEALSLSIRILRLRFFHTPS